MSEVAVTMTKAQKKSKLGKFLARTYVALATIASVSKYALVTAWATPTPAGGGGFGSDEVTITGEDVDADAFMGKIIGILLTITRYVGVALIVYGVYEIVMSFMQNQPEAKTKGIIMALAGVVMVALKSVLKGLGVIS